MNFNKPMIDLVREIRKHVPADVKPEIKLANPEMLYELIVMYHESKQTVFRTLVKELCHLAGSPYMEALEPPVEEVQQESPEYHARTTLKVYRGQTMLVETPSEEVSKHNDGKKRVYRGVVVE